MCKTCDDALLAVTWRRGGGRVARQSRTVSMWLRTLEKRRAASSATLSPTAGPLGDTLGSLTVVEEDAGLPAAMEDEGPPGDMVVKLGDWAERVSWGWGQRGRSMRNMNKQHPKWSLLQTAQRTHAEVR